MSIGARRERLGRLPSKVLCTTRCSGVPSARTAWAVFPLARASGCAKKLDISSSWEERDSPSMQRSCWDWTNPMNSQGTG